MCVLLYRTAEYITHFVRVLVPIHTNTMLLIAIFIALATQIRAQCAPGCDFALCDGGTALNAGSADKPLTGPLCTSMGDKVQAIASTGEALVDGEAPISKFIPEGLLQQFSTSFFKAYGDKVSQPMLYAMPRCASKMITNSRQRLGTRCRSRTRHNSSATSASRSR